MSLSDRGGGVGVPSVGKRVTKLPRRKSPREVQQTLVAYDIRQKVRLEWRQGLALFPTSLIKTSKSLPSLFLICLVSRCLPKGKE